MPSLKTEISEIAVVLGLRGIPLQRVTIPDLQGLVRDGSIDKGKAMAYLPILQGTTQLERLTHSQIQTLWNTAQQLAAQLGAAQSSQAYWSGPTRSARGVVISRDVELPSTFVSVKVESHVVYNLSPHNLFCDPFQAGSPGGRRGNWFEEVSPNLYYEAAQAYQKDRETPKRVEMFREVAAKSAQAFNNAWSSTNASSSTVLQRQHVRTEIIKRFLRINSAPYYLIALEQGSGVMVWVPDVTRFLQSWQVDGISAYTNPKDAQANVYFELRLYHKPNKRLVALGYRAEIRWSHGQFNGNPEAKLYKRFDYSEIVREGIYS